MKTALHFVACAGVWFAASAHAATGVYAVPGPWIDDAARSVRLENLSGGYTVATMA